MSSIISVSVWLTKILPPVVVANNGLKMFDASQHDFLLHMQAEECGQHCLLSVPSRQLCCTIEMLLYIAFYIVIDIEEQFC